MHAVLLIDRPTKKTIKTTGLVHIVMQVRILHRVGETMI